MLGVTAVIGRLFTEDDNRTPGGHPVAVLSYDLWRNQYGADPAHPGAKILVDEQPLTVIGVAAPGFHGVEVERRAEVWVPFMMAGGKINDPRMWWLWVLARRRPEVPRQQVQAAANVLMAQHLNAVYPTFYNAAFRKRALEQRLEVREASRGHLDVARGIRPPADRADGWPSDWSCWPPAPTWPTCCWRAERRGKKRSRCASRLAPRAHAWSARR